MPTPVRSLPATSSDFPSGIHCAPKRLRSSARVMLLGAAARRGDPDLVLPREVAAAFARIPVRDRLTVGREDRIVLEPPRRGERANRSRSRRRGAPRGRSRACRSAAPRPAQRRSSSVGRPAEPRGRAARRKHELERPRAAGQAVRRAAGYTDEPDVLRSSGSRRKRSWSAERERREMSRFAVLLGGRVARRTRSRCRRDATRSARCRWGAR